MGHACEASDRLEPNRERRGQIGDDEQQGPVCADRYAAELKQSDRTSPLHGPDSRKGCASITRLPCGVAKRAVGLPRRRWLADLPSKSDDTPMRRGPILKLTIPCRYGGYRGWLDPW